MATSAGDSRSLSGSAGAADHRQVHGVRCVVHNFPDDDEDAESTIRSLLEPDIILRDCQQSTTGLSDFIIAVAILFAARQHSLLCRALY